MATAGMRRMSRRRSLVLIVAVFNMVGCTKWVVTDPQALRDSLAGDERQLRLTDPSGHEMEIMATRASQDSVYVKDETEGISFSEIGKIEIRQEDFPATAALIVLVLGGSFLIYSHLDSQVSEIRGIGSRP